VQADPNIPSFKENPQAGSVPPLLPISEPPMMGALPPPVVGGGPPPLPPKASRRSPPAGQKLAILLSLCLGLFLADGVVSLVDESLILFFDIHALRVIRGIVFLFAMLVAIVIYGLMGLTPMIPKRRFLPLTLFNPVAGLAVVPFLIYFSGRSHQIAWGISFCQVILGLGVLYLVHGGFKFRWPLVAENQLEGRRFSWRNLSVFLLVNVLVLLPALIVYSVFCAALAVDHFSEGFLALRPAGLTVQVRKYVRSDGKTIQLVPMSHIGEADFYRTIAQSFPTDSIILMEGVTDNRNLLTNKITYKRMATSLGVAEQQNDFQPRGKLVQADVDVEQFNTNTIDCLNLVMLIHSKGVNAETVLQLMQFSPPHFEEQLFDDLLGKRNRRLMEEIHARLSQSQNLIVPWGAAHMPQIAREIQKSGFLIRETQEYVAIRFRYAGSKSKNAVKAGDYGKPK
jgi:hypothetical protein